MSRILKAGRGGAAGMANGTPEAARGSRLSSQARDELLQRLDRLESFPSQVRLAQTWALHISVAQLVA